MTSVSLLSLLTMPCRTSFYLRSLSSLSGYERCVERSAAAKHDASGNAMALSGSAPILWYLRAAAVAWHNLVNPYEGLCGGAGRSWPSESACTIEAPACSISWTSHVLIRACCEQNTVPPFKFSLRFRTLTSRSLHGLAQHNVAVAGQFLQIGHGATCMQCTVYVLPSGMRTQSAAP